MERKREGLRGREGVVVTYHAHKHIEVVNDVGVCWQVIWPGRAPEQELRSALDHSIPSGPSISL